MLTDSVCTGPRRTAPLLLRSGISGLHVTYAADEKALFQELVAVMRRCVSRSLITHRLVQHGA